MKHGMLNRLKWGLLLLLAIPSAAFAQDMPRRPDFYVYMTTGDKTELVKIDANTIMPEAIAEIDPFYVELPVTVDKAMPEVEVKAFYDNGDDKNRYLKQPGISKFLENLWTLKEDEFLLHRNYMRCEPMPTDCYGYTEFSLLNTTTDIETAIWTLPYHEKRFDDTRPCYEDVMYEGGGGLPMNVRLNPTQDMIAITINPWRCDSFLVLIDYSTEVPQIQRLDNITAMSWSPDGTELAYTELKDGLYEYGRMVLATGVKTPFQLLKLDHASWMVWLDAETILYARPLMPVEEMDYQEAVVWHNLTRHSEAVLPMAFDLTPDQVFRLSDEQSSVIYSTTWLDGETQGWNTILTDDPSETHQAPQKISSGNSRRPRYAAATVCAGIFEWCDEYEWAIVDVDGNLSLMNLDYYREKYGADSIRFAALGVDE